MGKIGREIVGHDVDAILEDLNRAAAAELHDAYRYRFLAKQAEGLQSRELAEWFAKTAEDEWQHLGLWMDRIFILGGRPFTKPSEAESLTYTEYEEPPDDATDLKAMIESSLKGERAAIRFYEELYRKTLETDPVTAHLARKAMADEVGDEDDLERFLAGFEKAQAREHHVEPAGRRK